ncbi:LTA synthase family protein [Ruminococcaceae bacterium OttesenSCG-928-L11]|nr:LTA synthase family protein [Ruminococcaceae bacterium OttesenSCG-928-L11]
MQDKLKSILKSDRFKNYLNCALLFFTIGFIVLVFGPVHISKNNNTLLNQKLLVIISLGCAGAALILASVSLLLKKHYKYLACILTGLLILCFVNATIIPFQATILDGRDLVTMEDDLGPVVRNIVLLVFMIIASYALHEYLKKISIPLLGLCLALTMFNQYELGAFKHTDKEAINKQRNEIIESASGFSTDKNILIIGVDSFQGTLVERTFDQNPYLLDYFDGFTFFSRAFSSFPYTNYSRSAILSGKEYSTTDLDYMANIINAYNDSFITDMQQNGIMVNGYGVDLIGVAPSVNNFIESKVDPKYMYGYALAASVARVAGYWPSNPFFGEVDTLILNSKLESVKAHEILLDNFHVEASAEKCLFFWDYTLHAPVVLSQNGEVVKQEERKNDEQALIDEITFECKQVNALFEKMKQNNVYDNTLIIILSDHGQHHGAAYRDSIGGDFVDGNKKNGNYVKIGTYNPAILIKPPFSTGAVEISQNDLWNGDLRAILNNYILDFTDISPIELAMDARKKNPVVKVMFAESGSNENEYLYSSIYHQTVEVTSLYDIPEVFAQKSGIRDE